MSSKLLSLLTIALFLDLFLWYVSFFPPSSRLSLYFLSVGQGDAELIELPGPRPARLLVDSGPPGGGVTSALSPLMPLSGSRLDIAIATHADLDHSGDFPAVFSRYPVSVFIENGLPGTTAAWQKVQTSLMEHQIPSVSLRAGDRILYASSTVSVLYPPAAAFGVNTNVNAIVLLVDSGGHRALFTSDIDAAAEEKIAANYNLKDIDILKVAHHGSKYSSSSIFLNAVRPAVSVIEVGRNSYGHPTSAALANLAAVGSRVFRTDRDGTVKITFAGSRAIISSLR